jgi:hypothetical protein
MLFIAVLLVVAWIFWRSYAYYFEIAATPELLQPQLEDLTQDLLHMRKPIVLAERIVDHRELLSRSFKYEYAFAIDTYNDAPRATTAKYTVVFAKQTPRGHALVDLLHPPTGRVLRVRLYDDQTLVLPPHWAYRPDQAVHEWALYDALHAAMWYSSRLWNS